MGERPTMHYSLRSGAAGKRSPGAGPTLPWGLPGTQQVSGPLCLHNTGSNQTLAHPSLLIESASPTMLGRRGPAPNSQQLREKRGVGRGPPVSIGTWSYSVLGRDHV